MDYVIYLTERCNLRCAYCDATDVHQDNASDIQYSLDDLVAFLNDDDDLGIQFYGGEPLLRPDLMVEILERTRAKRVGLQTNGCFLDRIQDSVLDRIGMISLSIDGDRKTTDRARGDGVYDLALTNAQQLRHRGFQGRIDARMTTSPGTHIYDAVMHLIECGFAFDAIHWQLNVLFHREDWHRDQRFIRRWFERYYNPEITRLVDAWTDQLRSGTLWNIVPFAVLMHDLLTGRRVDHVRCGGGHKMWTITINGDLFPCPVMRHRQPYAVGNINATRPSTMGLRCLLVPPCDSCDILGVCGGRCLSANLQKRWGDDGFGLVCDSVRHLVGELERVAPVFRARVESGSLDVRQLNRGASYEVIP